MSFTSAFRRAAVASAAFRRDSLSSTLDSVFVRSSCASFCPRSTISPSRTIRLWMMPPSRDWMTCSCEDGMTLPLPVVTSSRWNRLAQAINTASSANRDHATSDERGRRGSFSRLLKREKSFMPRPPRQPPLASWSRCAARLSAAPYRAGAGSHRAGRPSPPCRFPAR